MMDKVVSKPVPLWAGRIEAIARDHGNLWCLYEIRRDETGKRYRREIIADGLNAQDAELLVKMGNRFFNLLEVVNQPAPWEG